MTRTISTDALVIGGGVTGCGVVWDLALRGVSTVLVEKGDLAYGTSGRYHGLLHSGGRYAVRDPESARECAVENRILRRVATHTIEDTGGFFVVTPEDDPTYADQWLQACVDTGIPAQEITVRQAMQREPLLNPQTQRVFFVPDAAIDGFELLKAMAEGAKAHNAQVLTYHKVQELIVENGTVVGAVVHDLLHDEEVHIEAGVVVNAAGAWAGQVAAMAGAQVTIRPSKGTMVAYNHRVVNTVLNRCHLAGDGDILVPIHTVSIIGTTSVPVNDPDRYEIEPWEIEKMMTEAVKLVPALSQARVLRAWAGVRPLYEETQPRDGEEDLRAVSRTFALLNHETRDGIVGFLSIVGGKLTTYRLMAEKAADAACARLGVDSPCRTAEVPIPGSEQQKYHALGARLAARERERRSGQLICECELVHRHEIINFIRETETQSLDDIRRGLRLGMGPCQGGFCAYRAVGILHQEKSLPVEQGNQSLTRFLDERWKGTYPVLWGDQLRQYFLDDWIYRGLLNSDVLPAEGPLPEAVI
ncbi:MAG TPA: anaerobic glycerol-3-phosphate dehydrogenase subunit A [Anaerolineae bacterium]|nr:anaerobic glycerol-3-phosphate dehydrogenase subunit A [Anaerolineae bacterium]